MTPTRQDLIQALTTSFSLQALQFDGSWAIISTHALHRDAQDAMFERGGWKRNAVKYRVTAARI